ncbi:hypothetical protein SAMN05421812_11122 [Asanoa hainanensis]|uniref:Uncharacterized protein n=1 Tax=Asanoa hainanensis TaxID=560556 RepID=A0A239NWR4_9ACTN|nr:hypothetical protein [Asanoa hainanensis]SNT58559.1 hypothetical protein SAMN05421812_11122 [Asanoa hainanensis]
MLALLFLAVLGIAPLLALVLLMTRLPRAGAGSPGTRVRAALRSGLARPVWPGLVAVVVVAGALTFGLEQGYLAAVPNSPRWGFDVALLAVMLAPAGALACAGLSALAAAAVAQARGFGAGTVTGLLTLLAVAVGSAAAHLPLLAIYRADPSGFPVIPNLGEGDLLAPFTIFPAALIWAAPWPVIGAALDAREDSRPPVRDRWQLLLDLTTADLPESRSAWGAALRAELAVIDPPKERRGFALGGAWAAVRSGASRGTWLGAAGVLLVVAAASLAASRWELAHGRGGVLVFWTTVPNLLLLAIALATAWRTRSFGAGLRAGLLAGLAALVAVLVVGIPEAVVWANQRAGYLTTGDAVPPDWQSAVRDLLRPEFLVSIVVAWTAAVASGAAVGAALGRLHRRAHPNETTATV